MKLLFDQNISPRILKNLSPEIPDCQQVRFVGLEDSADFDIFQFAKANDFAIVTFDADLESATISTLKLMTSPTQ